ncbi:MAG: hypothetical protein LBG52_03480 [Candidatus Peribacteria bacterium]|jgi:hypothetical protein|nr:hypothetical protein [Candidatus Peribacteria bacterium]
MLKSFTGKQARAEIFDIGGSKALTGRQSTANSYKAYSTYASPTAKTTKAGEKNNSYTQNERLPIIQMPFNEVDFFKIWNNGKDGKVNNQPRSTKFTPTTFQIYRERGGKNRMTSKTHSYKIISSIIKNTSILPEQLNGMQTTKFGTGSKLTNYYQTLTEKLTTTLANFTTSSTKVTEMGTIIEAELSGLTTNLSDIENKIQTINGVQENISTLTNQINTLTYHINRLTDEINTLIEEINSGTLDDATLTDKQNELANKQNERTNNQNERSNKQNQRSNAQTNATSIGQQLNQTIINTTNNIKATITALKPIPDQTTEDEITEIEQIPNNFEELYNIVNNLNIDEVMETLTTIEMFEQETLKDANQQIEFASGRIKEIKIHLDQIHTTYKSIVTKYNTTYTKINNTLTRLSTQLSNTTNSQKYNQARLSGYIQTSTHTDFQKLIGTKTDTLTLTTDSSIPIDFATFFNILFIESGLQKATANDFDHINISEEVRTKFERMFTGLNQDEQLTIPGLNIITPDRPIDSPRYTTFQGINAQEVKFIYPNLYKVEVYKSGSGGTQLLKTIPEIKAALETYLKNKVNEYNTILNTITPTATTNAYTKLQSL